MRTEVADADTAIVVSSGARSGGIRALPLVLRLWLEQQRISTEAIDADTTIFVSIGARSGGIRSCGWFSRGDEPRATCSRSASYRRQLHRR